MINKPITLNENNFQILKGKPGMTPGAFGVYTNKKGEQYNVVLKLSTPSLNSSRQHVVECFVSECLTRLGQTTLPIVKVNVNEDVKSSVEQIRYGTEWRSHPLLDEGTIKIDFNQPNIVKIENMDAIAQGTRIEPVMLRTIDGCVDALKSKFGEDTPLVNDFLQQQLCRILFNNNDYNVDDMFSVVTFEDGTVSALPMYDFGSAITIGAFSKDIVAEHGLDGDTLSHLTSYQDVAILSHDLFNQPTAMGTTKYTDNWWNGRSQQQLVEHIAKTYPESAKQFYGDLQKFDEEDVFFITESMEQNEIIQPEESRFLQDFMWARQNEMMQTLSYNLTQDNEQ